MKRKAAGPPVMATVENGKLDLGDLETLFRPAKTCSVILAFVELMADEGFEWVRVDEK